MFPPFCALLFLGLACRGRCCIDEPEEPACAAESDPKDLPSGDKANAPWPLYGGTIQRNMVNTVDKNIPETWSVGEDGKKNIKWIAELGDLAYGGPVIAGGRIFVGTNNEKPRDPKVMGDKGIMMCFRESDGKFLWQAVHDKLENPDENDYPKQGVASSPAVDGDRLYYVNNRCELVCADVAGDEKTGKAKFNWTLDMIKDLKVYPALPRPLLAAGYRRPGFRRDRQRR